MKLKVGVVVLVGLIIFFAAVIYVGSEESLFTTTYELKLFVPNIQGLTKGSMVALVGLKVGSVQDLTFAKRNGQNGVDITLKIEEKYRSSITLNSHAILRTIGLLGDKFVDISIGGGKGTSAAVGRVFESFPNI
jgi:phospholipid/cholesterol/gamma-HCH transport system substrate-binding protein